MAGKDDPTFKYLIEVCPALFYHVAMYPYDLYREPKTKKEKIIAWLKDAAIKLFFAVQIFLFLVMSEYWDVFGPMKYDMGRTKNSIAAVVAGIIGQRLHERSDIDLEIQKFFYPNARVTGGSGRDTLNTYVNLAFTSVHFEARKDTRGMLQGEVHKSEFNWIIRQISDTGYSISRWGPKFDGSLDIIVRHGIIHGTFVRNGPHFDWLIRGNYDTKGKITCKITGPFTLGIVLKGKITKI